MSSTSSGTEKKRLDGHRRCRYPPQAEVDGDRDALARAAIGAHAVRQPAREDDEHAGLRREPLCLAERGAVRSGKRQGRRVHDRSHAARVLDLELAAERRIGADAAVVDIVRGRPECAGMRVELVAVAVAVDVGPRVDPPAEVVPLTGAVDGDLVGDGPAKRQHLLHRRAAPLVQVPARLPAAVVRTLHGLARGLAGEDDALELGVQRLGVRQRGDHERRREKIEQRQLRRVDACGPLRPRRMTCGRPCHVRSDRVECGHPSVRPESAGRGLCPRAALLYPETNSRMELMLTEAQVRTAVANGIKFVNRTREPYGLWFMGMMHRLFRVPEFADALKRYDEVMAERPQRGARAARASTPQRRQQPASTRRLGPCADPHGPCPRYGALLRSAGLSRRLTPRRSTRE